MNDRTIIGGVVVVLLVVGVLLFVTGDTTSRISRPTDAASSSVSAVASGPNLPLAQCIADSGAVFYGAFWCSHCHAQKELFADAVPALPYVECSTADGNEQTFVCKEKGIKSYPTWRFADGSELTGEVSLATLASKTGCTAVLPVKPMVAPSEASSSIPSGTTLQ